MRQAALALVHPYDIVAHFERRQKVIDGKTMIVVMSRRNAAELYQAIINIRSEWYNRASF